LIEKDRIGLIEKDRNTEKRRYKFIVGLKFHAIVKNSINGNGKISDGFTN